MDDQQIADEIEALEAEERTVRAEEGRAGDAGRQDVVARDAERLEQIRLRLHQLEDLKRQRQAKRNAGQDPDEAELRPADQIEGYLG